MCVIFCDKITKKIGFFKFNANVCTKYSNFSVFLWLGETFCVILHFEKRHINKNRVFMQLIVDSGSTKTEWLVVENFDVVKQIFTKGDRKSVV